MPHRGHSRPGSGGKFVTTQWSLVMAAGDPADAAAQDALASLCRAYWRPVFAFIRRWGVEHDRALDLTQGFFARLIEKNDLAQARRERGRFRTFLLACLRHHMANEHDSETALRRGGGIKPVELDGLDAAARARLEPVADETPEMRFNREWVHRLLDDSLERLGDEMRRLGSGDRFDHLLPFIIGESDITYREIAARLEMTENACKVAVHRLRRRFQALLREEVAHTVGSTEEVEDELRYLLQILAP